MEEESPAAGGEVDVNPPDRPSRPHSTGETENGAASNNYCYYQLINNKFIYLD